MTSYKNKSNIREDMNIVIVGHVDHGKSTIIGRLLSDTNSLPKGKLSQVQEMCRRNARPFEYAFLLDALKDEQSQGITIDAARVFFKTNKRDYMIIDAPGHIEFLKNMVSGAARAEAALLVIDANEGIKENSRRHGYLLSMLGIKQICVLVNKMDLVYYSEDRFNEIKNEYSTFLNEINIKPNAFIPVSGIMGDNIASSITNMNWYDGNTVLDMLDHFKSLKQKESLPFRLFVQDIYKFTQNNDHRRIVAGTIDSGKISVGDKLIFYPSGKKSTVKSIEVFNAIKPKSVSAGNAVGFTLDEQIYIKRGDVACIVAQKKPKISTRFSANIFWLGKEPLIINKKYILKIGTSKVIVRLKEIVRVIDASSLSNQNKKQIDRHDVSEIILETEKAIAFDLASEIDKTSRFVLVDEYEIAGGGIITSSLSDEVPLPKRNILWQDVKVTYDHRCKNLKQRGVVIWFTGLSASGKSTIAIEVEKKLYERGFSTYLLDGDNVRHGLSSDLAFSIKDREENLRRITEVSALFKDAGLITLVSFISPFEKARQSAKEKIGDKNFIEVYVKADIETCSMRDPKGLYEKAKKGLIKDFTGISSPYEEPKNPDVLIDTTVLSVEQCTQKILDIILYKQNI
ncbi:adenylyl-sulfate kinase [Crassaminicella profunda]|uniref:adenylyl-sulfate kinase n=1 Tax=Crassaminicella profunda TaxID=1286698 RepID=UPI001FE3F4FA|nr:adenylyl-sulfate kinase [Crassaminicella profunda]